MAARIARPGVAGKIVAKPMARPSRERMREIIRQMAEKHRTSLDILASYDRGEIERPQLRRSCQA